MENMYHAAAILAAFPAIGAVLFLLVERCRPILRLFLTAMIFGSLSTVCMFERIQTGIWLFDVGSALFGLLMFLFIGLVLREIIRWWRYWGPA